MSRNVLVRYGMISEVARFAAAADIPFERGMRVVIRTHRGLEIGLLLEGLLPAANGSSLRSPAKRAAFGDGAAIGSTEQAIDEQLSSDLCILRAATAEDERTASRLRDESEREFSLWRDRIGAWKLHLELIDLEWTLDKMKLILYVLNDRGPECTKLALQAAAAGLGTIEVQPVGPDGPMVVSGHGGCGSGHCGSGDNSNGCCS